MKNKLVIGIAAALLAGTSGAFAGSSGVLYPTIDGGLTKTSPDQWNYCGTGTPGVPGGAISAGPQSPRDIDSRAGTNTTLFNTANAAEKMNLCNIHYHRNAEHKSAAFSTFVDTHDEHSGWAIAEPASTDPAYRAAHDIGGAGHEIGIIPGDTIEVHWVHTSCDVDYEELDPANGLGSCLTSVCANPQLRVVTQVFQVVEHDADVTSLEHPMKHSGNTVVYTGSTTGPSYNNDHCSPLQVTWDVKKSVATIDAHALAEWSHEQGEHAHGVRELVTRPELLSRIKKSGRSGHN